jgi:hypothetical protein
MIAGRFTVIRRASRCGSCSHTASSNIRCAHILISRCNSTVVTAETDTEISTLVGFGMSAWDWKAIRRMKETPPSLPGKGQMAKGARRDCHSGSANNVSSNPGHLPTSHSWSLRRRHTNFPSSINSSANKVCSERRHRSMPASCPIGFAIALPSQGLNYKSGHDADLQEFHKCAAKQLYAGSAERDPRFPKKAAISKKTTLKCIDGCVFFDDDDFTVTTLLAQPLTLIIQDGQKLDIHISAVDGQFIVDKSFC